MTTLTWPTINRKTTQLDWSLVSNTQSFVSPLSGAVQTVEMPGARWRAVFTLSALDATDSAALRAFLVQLRGQSGRFYLYNFARQAPMGVATGSASVDGSGQTGTTLATTGWTINQTGILKAGDFIGVNGELKMVVADCNSNASGQATVTFEPPLRSSPPGGSSITVTRPTAIFKLDEDAVRWVTTAPLLDSVTISCTEVW